MPVSRRRFLCTAIGAGVGLGVGTALWRSRSDQYATEDLSVTRSSRAFGTEVSITAMHSQHNVAERALTAAFAELETVEEVMSLYRPHSQLCRLNRDGFVDSPHPYLLDVLRHAVAVSERSGGAFDVTVQPLWTVSAAAKKEQRLPSAQEVELALAKVNWKKLQITPEGIVLEDTGMAVTLNGIAQGFAADRAALALRNAGIERALVNTGEIGALGTKPGSEPWTVGIQHPRDPEAYISLAKLVDRSLSTSGDYATSFSDDHVHHHIFNPQSGCSPEEFSNVSVVAASGLEADALSTAVFVLGMERGLELIRATPKADALVVLKDGRMHCTSGFPIES